MRLEADFQFYSANQPIDDRPLPADAKTGLGSSAALVSSLIAAIFSLMGAFDRDHSDLVARSKRFDRCSNDGSFIHVHSR